MSGSVDERKAEGIIYLHFSQGTHTGSHGIPPATSRRNWVGRLHGRYVRHIAGWTVRGKTVAVGSLKSYWQLAGLVFLKEQY